MNPDLSQSKLNSKNELNSKKDGSKVEKGRKFEDEVASLYRLMGYTVERNISICNKKVDIRASFCLPMTKD